MAWVSAVSSDCLGPETWVCLTVIFYFSRYNWASLFKEKKILGKVEWFKSYLCTLLVHYGISTFFLQPAWMSTFSISDIDTRELLTVYLLVKSWLVAQPLLTLLPSRWFFTLTIDVVGNRLYCSLCIWYQPRNL